jgi:magnesium-transporting ATPase (P-type)
VGDATDPALYNLCVERCSIGIEKVRTVNPRLKALPFNSSNKFMISGDQLETVDPSIAAKDRAVLIMMKGALDIVIQRCSAYTKDNDDIKTLDDAFKEELFARQEELGKNGYRVIAMCRQRMTQEQYDDMLQIYKNKQKSRSSTSGDEDLGELPSSGYCFIGLFSLLDPARPEVLDAVLKVRRAKICVVMVIGDHPTIAKAIAKQVNILTTEIADINGIDTFKFEKGADGRSMLNVYRNDKLLQQHAPAEVTRGDSVFANAKQKIRAVSNEARVAEPGQASWYKCAWYSCRSRRGDQLHG